MENFKEKLVALRGEISIAIKRVGEIEKKAIDFQTQHVQKMEELTILREHVKVLDEHFAQVADELNAVSGIYRVVDLRSEQLNHKAINLEQELKVWDKKNSDLVWDKKNSELDEKAYTVNTEIDKLKSQKDNI